MRKSCAAFLAAACGLAGAADFTGSGHLEVGSASWFDAYSSVCFGEGRLDYTGGDAQVAVPLCFNPAGTRKAATLSVAAGATLTLAGADQVLSSGALVKTGAGTLAIARENVSFRNGTAVSAGTAPAAAAWDADGNLTAGWLVKGLNVHAGEVSIRNATADFGDTLRVGGMGSGAGATLALDGVRVKPMKTLYVGSFGTNPVTTAAQPVSRLVAKDSVFEDVGDIHLNRTSGTYGKGQSLESEVVFDNSLVTNTGSFWMDPNVDGVRSRTTLTLDHGATFVGSSSALFMAGGANVSVTTNTINILNGSKLLARNFGMDTYWGGTASNVVNVGAGSVLGFSRTVSQHSASRWNTAFFDGGTLRPWCPNVEPWHNASPATRCMGLLFHRWDNVQVSSGGLTLLSPPNSYAYCYAAIRPDAKSPGGQVAVTGGGTFATAPTELPITVTGGSTLMLTPRHFLNEDTGLTMSGNRIEYNPRISNASVTLDADSSIRVQGRSQVLMDMTLPAGAISFGAVGCNEPPSSKLATGDREWSKTGSSSRLYDGDGAYTLMDGSNQSPDQPHAVVYRKPLDLTRSFRITFEYANAPLNDRVVKGIVAYIHNDARGPEAAGCGNTGLGYTTNGVGGTAHVDRSVGVMVRTWAEDHGVYFCRNGYADRATKQTLPVDPHYRLQPTRTVPLVVTFAYDAAAKKVSYHVGSPYGPVDAGVNYATGASRGSYDYDVGNTVSADLAQICGGSGYFAVSTSADGGSVIQQQIANVSIRYLDAVDRACVDVAGNLALGAGTARLSAYGTDTTAGYAMRELRFADGGTLDIASTNLAWGAENTAFVAFDRWVGSGSVTKTGGGNLGLRAQTARQATLNLSSGGLVLRKDYEDPYTVDPDRDEWIAVNWRGNWLSDAQWPLYAPASEKGVWCGTTDTGISGSSALKRKLKISGRWRMSFDYESQQNDGAYGAFLTFHNDPRGWGAATDRGWLNGKEYTEGYAILGNTAARSVKNSASLHFYNYAESDSNSAANHKLKWWTIDAAGTRATEVLSNTSADGTGNEQIYIANYDLKGKGSKVGRRFHCEIDYDDAQALPLTITLTQTQGADGTEGATRRWSKSFAKNIASAVGDEYAYLGLFFSTGGQVTRVKFANLRFEHLDAAESNAQSYLARVNVTAPAATVYLDGSKETTFKLADKVDVAGALTVKSLRAAGTLDLGAATVADGASLTADGARVRLSSKEGLDGKSVLGVANGGVLQLDFAGAANVDSFTVDGVTYRKGTFSARTCAAIAGTGSLTLGRGTVLIFR